MYMVGLSHFAAFCSTLESSGTKIMSTWLAGCGARRSRRLARWVNCQSFITRAKTCSSLAPSCAPLASRRATTMLAIGDRQQKLTGSSTPGASSLVRLQKLVSQWQPHRPSKRSMLNCVSKSGDPCLSTSRSNSQMEALNLWPRTKSQSPTVSCSISSL